jgi:glycogen synthase
MRVLILSWEYPPLVYGGLGRHVHALAEAQAQAGHEVAVVTQAVDSAPADSVVNGVRVVRVAPDPPNLPMSDLLAWVMAFEHALTRAALRTAEELRPEVVHGHDWMVAHTAATLKHAYGIPVVATVHATEAGRNQGWLPTPLNKAIHSVEWWLTSEAARVISCSSHMSWEVTRLFDLPADRVAVIPNGIDLTDWVVPPEAVSSSRRTYAADGPLLVFTGRLEWEKGCHTLLDALPRLRRRHPGLRLVVVGRGSKSGDLKAHARRLRLGRSVRFLGWVPQAELAALAAAADVAVVPSIYEPFGLVALEAAASGTPLVVGDTGGLREIVEHGLTGLRFEPGDVAGLAEAVSSLLADEVLARRLERAARAMVKRDYAWSAVATRTVDVYSGVVREEAQDVRQNGLQARGRAHPRLDVGDGNLLTDGL